MITPKQPKKSAYEYKPKKTILLRNIDDVHELLRIFPLSSMRTVSGRLILNLRGCIINGVHLNGDGGQGEKQEPLLDLKMQRVSIQNFFAKNVKESLRIFSPHCSIEGAHFLDVGEDAISNMREAHHTMISGCSFLNSTSGDKSIQLNQGSHAVVSGCYISGGITGIRIGKEGWNTTKDNALIKDCIFNKGGICKGMRTAIHASSITISTDNNVYERIKEPIYLHNAKEA